MFTQVKSILQKMTPKERCPKRLALAASLSVYIAFSPFFGLHTIMHIVFGWVLGLNIPLLLAVGYAINNPWTMIPVYSSGYFCGHWLLHCWAGVPVSAANPWWMQTINTLLQNHLGLVDVSFWAFMVGANLLGIVLACVSYPLLRIFFARLLARNVSYSR